MRSPRTSRLIQLLCLTFVCLLSNVGLPHALDQTDSLNPEVLVTAKLHQEILRDHPKSLTTPVELAHLIQSVAAEYHLDPYVLLGLVKTESSYDATAKSSVGALGLTQMMPAMIKHYGMTPKTFLACVRCQLELGAKHLIYLLNRFDGRPDLALLSYHGSLTPSQSRYILRIHRIAKKSALTTQTPSLTHPTVTTLTNTAEAHS